MASTARRHPMFGQRWTARVNRRIPFVLSRFPDPDPHGITAYTVHIDQSKSNYLGKVKDEIYYAVQSRFLVRCLGC